MALAKESFISNIKLFISPQFDCVFDTRLTIGFGHDIVIEIEILKKALT